MPRYDMVIMPVGMLIDIVVDGFHGRGRFDIRNDMSTIPKAFCRVLCNCCDPVTRGY